jgi:tRNA (guanine-N7-)-methyltransferase
MQKRTLNDYSQIGLIPTQPGYPINFLDIFGRPGPVHVEIGSGKGAFLLAQARLNPDINFLGIEWARKYFRFCIDRFGRWGIQNVRMIRDDATIFLEKYIPDSSISCFHVYFPDPWPKKHHHKRRFFSPRNLPQIHRCLVPDGVVRFVTDDRDYFEDTLELIYLSDLLWEKRDLIPSNGTNAGELVGTNYEKKYLKEGRFVYAVEFRKLCYKGTEPYIPKLLNVANKSTDIYLHQSI